MKYLNTNLNIYVPNTITVWNENNYCTPAALVEDGKAEEFGIVEVIESSQPDYNAISQRLVGTAVSNPTVLGWGTGK